MTGMVGRSYVWRGRVWRVIARWRHVPALERTCLCPGCGLVLEPAGPALFCDCVPMPDTQVLGVIRNVLIEDVQTGERVVRPFRGLRRADRSAT